MFIIFLSQLKILLEKRIAFSLCLASYLIQKRILCVEFLSNFGPLSFIYLPIWGKTIWFKYPNLAKLFQASMNKNICNVIVL